MNNFVFIGHIKNPSYLLEFNKEFNKVIIYKPDKYSLKTKDYFEKYYLGVIIEEYILEDIILNKENLINYKKNYLYAPEIILKHKKNYVLINENIKELKVYKKL